MPCNNYALTALGSLAHGLASKSSAQGSPCSPSSADPVQSRWQRSRDLGLATPCHLPKDFHPSQKLSKRHYRLVRDPPFTHRRLPSTCAYHLRLAFPHTFPSIGSTNAPHFLILFRTFLLLPLVSYAMVASLTTVASASRFVHSQSPDTP